MADVDIRYALFKDLGRTTYLPLNTTTNHIGRYPIHMHHLSGPLPTPANGYQFTLVGNAVDGGSVETKFKWGIAVHGSHYGADPGQRRLQLQRRLDRDRGRVGELQRLRPQLRAARASASPTTRSPRRAWRWAPRASASGSGGRTTTSGTTSRPTSRTRPTEAALWVRLPVPLPGQHRGPELQGRRPGIAGQFTTRNGNNMPILQFENNEAYGAMQGGFTYWWVELPGSAALRERAGKRHQGSEDLERLQQGRLHVSRAEGHLRRPEDPGQFQLGRPLLRQRRVLRGLFVEGHRHPQFRHPGDGGGHHRARGRASARNRTSPSRIRTCATTPTCRSRPTGRSTAAGWTTSWWSPATRGSTRRPDAALSSIAMVRDVAMRARVSEQAG